jgi:broad-specificity NMP kinase
MVKSNIIYLLKNFLENSNFDYVVFNWVIHREDILDDILSELSSLDFTLCKITLICSENALRERMQKDGRSIEAIKTSIQRLNLYDNMSTIKVDTTNKPVDRTVNEVLQIIEQSTADS